MPTVAEALKASGFTDDQIKALDAKVISALDTVAAEANQTLQNAEVAQRAAIEFYDKKVTPSINAWGNEKVDLESQIAFYRTQAEQAKAQGFLPTSAPGYTPPANNGRAPNGQFVPGGNQVPGSPSFEDLERRTGNAISNGMWAMQEYARLNGGAILPDEIETLANEATNLKLPFRDHVSRKYNFETKRASIAAEAKKVEMEAFAKEKVDANNREWAERTGSNPNTRQGLPSEYAQIRKGVSDKSRPDPLALTPAERHASTRNAIHAELKETA